MSATVLVAPVSPAEYLEREEAAQEKHELHEGQVLLMAGGSERHSFITIALTSLLFGAVRGRRCRAFNSDCKVIVPATGSYYYPDAMVACPPNFVDRKSGIIDNPTVIIEVLSPSTEAFDRGAKFRAYEQISSLQEYVLVESETIFVEVFARQSDETWRRTTYSGLDAVVDLRSIEVQVAMSELYEDTAGLTE